MLFITIDSLALKCQGISSVLILCLIMLFKLTHFRCSIIHIRRSTNHATHYFAKSTVSKSYLGEWREVHPSLLMYWQRIWINENGLVSIKKKNGKSIMIGNG